MAEKLEFKNDIDVISVLRTRLLGYTTGPDGTTLLNAGNLTIKEVGEAILQDSGLREQIAQIIGVHADDVERIQEAIETLQGIDTDYGQRVTALEEGKADKENTYTKDEVDSLVDGATPKDYEAVKYRVANVDGRLENVEASVDLLVNDKAVLEGYSVPVPADKDLAPKAMVKGMEGETEVFKRGESVKSNNYDWWIGKATVNGSISQSNYESFKVGDKMVVYGTNTTSGESVYFIGVVTNAYQGNVVYTPYDGILHVGTFTDWIRHSTIEGYSSRGANLWDEEWEVGSINITNGANTPSSAYIRGGFIEVLPNTDYFGASSNGKELLVLQFRGDKTVAKSWVDATNKKFTTLAETRYVRLVIGGNTYNNDVAFIEGDTGVYAPYVAPTSFTFSEPITLKKGDRLDPQTGEVVEAMGLSSDLEWVFQNEDVYYAVVSDIKQEVSMELMCNRYETTTFMYSSVSRPDKTISSRNNYNRVYIKDSAFVGHDADWVRNYLSGVEFIYPLAEPTTRNIGAIPATIDVFAGGEVSLIGNGLGKMTIEVTKLEGALQTRVKSLESQVKDLQDENAEQNDRITNLEYENRITKAVLAKKIAEETEATGTVIPFPYTGEEGYPLAEWGLLKRLKGESLVWNQLVNDITNSTYDYSASEGTFDVKKIVSNFNSSAFSIHYDKKFTPSHIYLFYNTIDVTIRFYDYFSGGGVTAITKGQTSVIKWTSDWYCQMGFADNPSIGVHYGRVFCIDLTTLFGVTDVSAVTDSMKTFVRTYAEAHPSYDAGTLLDSVYESGVSTGRNVFDADSSVRESNLSRNSDGSFRFAETAVRSYFLADFKPITRYTLSFKIKAGTCTGMNIRYTDGTSSSIGRVMSSGKFVVTSDAGKSVLRFDTNWNQGNVVDVYDVQIEEGATDSEYAEPMESTLDLSFLKGVPGIGTKDTVIDFEKEEVRWTEWAYTAKAGDFTKYDDNYYRASLEIANASTTLDCINPMGYTTYTYSEVKKHGSGLYFGNGTMNVYDESCPTVQSLEEKIAGKTFIYPLATPITRSFADLGIVVPSSWDGKKPWIRVEAGGTFTVVSSGAPAEATVSFVTDLTAK